MRRGGANILRVKSLPDRKYSFVAFVLILIAFGTRIAYLSAPSLWLDEAISANIARSPLTSCIQFAKGDLHPPLYYLLIHLWSLIGHDEFTLRLFSVIPNFLSGVILFICVRQMFNPSIALLTLIFFAISPFQIRYSQEVRMYSLLGLWIVFVLFSVLQYLKSKSWGSLSCYIISASLGLYTHYQAVIFLTLINIAVFIRLFRTGKGNLWRWILAQLAIVALFSPWLPTFINQFKGGGRSWVPFLPSFPLFISPLFAFLWGEPILSKVYHSLWPFFLRLRELDSIIPWFEKLSLVIIFISIILMIWMGRKKLMRLSWQILFISFLLIGTLGLCYGLSFKTNIYGPKYLFGTSFIFYIFIAILLEALSRWNRKIGISLGLIVIIVQVFMLINYYQPGNYRENWRGAVAYIKDHSRPRQVVGFHFDNPMAPYVYYSDDSIPVFGFLKEGKLSPSFSTVIKNQYETLWLFDYLAELYDPGGMVKQKLVDHGYVPIWHHNFNGVPLTMWRKAEIGTY